jgi:hypothetical protein
MVVGLVNFEIEEPKHALILEFVVYLWEILVMSNQLEKVYPNFVLTMDQVTGFISFSVHLP